MSAQRILVTGGVRSGKSAYAERSLGDQAAVTYLAPGPIPDPIADPDWAKRIEAHRERRPAHWTTVETADVAGALRVADEPVLLDCLGTWLTRLIDDLRGWERPRADWAADWRAATDILVDTWRAFPYDAVAVTNEVGWGVVPAHASGRLFADLLGRVNQEMADASDEVVLMVAGRPLRL
jgi:adenosylcobinamide kinase / adenosylcobinamide-phosphate guanylyltransferase